METILERGDTILENQKLVLETIRGEEIDSTIKKLKELNILIESKKCILCDSNIDSTEKIGGFLPKQGKVAPFCDSIQCSLKAAYLVMKHNGNGSPIIENE